MLSAIEDFRERGEGKIDIHLLYKQIVIHRLSLEPYSSLHADCWGLLGIALLLESLARSSVMSLVAKFERFCYPSDPPAMSILLHNVPAGKVFHFLHRYFLTVHRRSSPTLSSFTRISFDRELTR